MNNLKLKNRFNVIYIIYGALIFGQLIFFVISYYLIENKLTETNQSVDGIFKILIPVVGIISMFVSYKLYNSRVSGYKESKELIQKLSFYLSNKIIQWAILEGSGFLSLVAFLTTGNYFYVIIFLFVIGFLILTRPSKENFFNDLKVSGSDRSLF